MRIATVGHAVFAATMVALGVLGLIDGDFPVIWQPMSKGMPGREVLVYACCFVSIASGVGLMWRRPSAAAARALLAYLVLWLLVFRVPGLFRSLGVDVYWSASRTAVIVAAAWVLYAWFATDRDARFLGFATGDTGLRIARALYGVAIIPFGVAHFQFVKQTAAQVPGWLPAHVAWVYFTGAAFIAAGVAMLLGIRGQLAAALSAFQMGVFLLLVWVPVALAGSMNAFQRGEIIVTWVLTAAGWVVADSYRFECSISARTAPITAPHPPTPRVSAPSGGSCDAPRDPRA